MKVSVAALLAVGVLAVLTVIAAVIDAKHQIIPNWLNALLAVSGFMASLCVINDPFGAIAGAAGGATIFLGVRLAYLRLRSIEGLGLGDVKFAAAGGVWTGILDLPAFIALAALSGLIYAGVRNASGKPIQATTRIPFGPFMAFGLLVVGTLRYTTRTNVLDFLFQP